MGILSKFLGRTQASAPVWQSGVTCLLCGSSIAFTSLSGVWWAPGDLDDGPDCPHQPGPAGGPVTVTACGSYEMDDDGAAGDQAWGVSFTLASAPGVTLTIWAYPSYWRDPGAFNVGYRCEYRYDTAAESTTAVQYDYDRFVFADLGECEKACRTSAQTMVWSRNRYGDGDLPAYAGFFDWDGVPC